LTVTAALGAFGWGCQASKGTAATISYWHRAHNVDFGEIESREVLDPEVGGTILTTGVIKTGVHAGGGLDISPRLEGDIGWLFHAMMGSSATTADSPEAGMYHHEFTFDTTDESSIKWITAAKWQPGSSAADDTGLRVTDTRVAAMRLMLPARGRVRMRLDMVGIKPEGMADPATNASWSSAFEEEDSIPITSKPAGGFELPQATPIYPSGCAIDFTNGLTDPVRQEAVIGSYYPDDLHVLTRAVIIRFPLKVSTYDKWTNAVFNTADASGMSTWTAWDPVTYSSTWEVNVESPGNVSGLSSPYKMVVYAQEVEWVVDPIAMVGNQLLLLNFTGTVVKPASGTAFRIELENEQSSYTWPT